MPHLLIAGLGYVGQATAWVFRDAGWKVTGWTATETSAARLGAAANHVRATDISERAQVEAARGEFDAVIQCASSGGGGAERYRRVYLESARNLLGVFAHVPLLFTSSTSVYAQTDGAWIDESSPAEPKTETGRLLRETELIVLAAQGTVARLAGIYGPGRSFLLQKFLSGEARLDPSHDRWINQVHRDDIANALFLLITKQSESAGQIFNVADGAPMQRDDCYRWFARELDRPEPLAGRESATRKRGESNKRVRNEKLRALGWQPRFPNFATAMRESILPANAALKRSQ